MKRKKDWKTAFSNPTGRRLLKRERGRAIRRWRKITMGGVTLRQRKQKIKESRSNQKTLGYTRSNCVNVKKKNQTEGAQSKESKRSLMHENP